VLKRLSDALAAGDRIIGLVRGSAVNHGGPTSGLTVPSGPAQRQLISDALESAALDAGRVDYVEAHGTGTQLGDAIEVNAIAGVFGESHSSERPLVIGSVKANIGHLEPASGVAGLIKVVAAMQAEEIPPQPHYRTPNPAINWAAMPVTVATAAPWRTAGGVPRVAGVSSFGMSGTNAHVIIEEAPGRERVDKGEERPLQVMRLSARNAVALRALAGRHAEALRKGGALLGDVCFTANVGRSRFAHRVAVTGDSAEAVAAALSAFAEEQEGGAIHGIAPQRESAPRIAFVFTGQGSQYAGMGRELYDGEPRFRAAVDRCAVAVADQMDLIGVLYGDAGAAIDQTRYAQPSLFAIGYALAELWSGWGIEPSMVMGHSVGELVAACVAGVFTPEDGMRLVAARGRLMQELEPGSMTAVFAHEARVREAIAGHEGDVSIAAVNAPENIVISGRTEVVHQIANELRAEGIISKQLLVSHAFHSPMMEPMLETFEQIAAGVSYQAPRRMLISNVTGSVAGEEIATAHYWREHVRATVQFERGVEALIEQGCDAVIEVGATATLLGLIAALPESHRMLTVASLRRNAGQWQQILTAAATLEVNGIDLDWLAFDAPYDRCRVPLPTYPFQRSRFWFDSDAEPVAAETIRRSAASPVYLDLGNDQVIAAGIVRDFVRKQIRNLLGLPVETAIAGGQRLHDLGVDSFGAVELRHRLQAVFGPAIVLPMTLFLDHPTVDAVAAFIAGQVIAAEAEPIDNVIGDLAALTDEEAEALLLGELLETGTR
jgi:acyl transferase domain-containing protein/acyl carrier protein